MPPEKAGLQPFPYFGRNLLSTEGQKKRLQHAIILEGNMGRI